MSLPITLMVILFMPIVGVVPKPTPRAPHKTAPPPAPRAPHNTMPPPAPEASHKMTLPLAPRAPHKTTLPPAIGAPHKMAPPPAPEAPHKKVSPWLAKWTIVSTESYRVYLGLKYFYHPHHHPSITCLLLFLR